MKLITAVLGASVLLLLTTGSALALGTKCDSCRGDNTGPDCGSDFVLSCKDGPFADYKSLQTPFPSEARH